MILVTGGAGLLGTTLIRMLLAEGRDVKAIYNKTPLPDFHSAHLKSEQCDILDVYALEASMQGVSEVYHCAGHVSFSPKDEAMLYKINVEGTANVVNAALEAGVRKFVHVSSVAALGRLREAEKITEAMQWTEETSNSKYGQSKYLGELEVWRGVSEGLNAVVVNPVIILGPGDWNDSSTKIFKSVYEEFPWYTSGISGFVDVRDAAAAMIALMDSDISGERFIVSAGDYPYRDIFNMIADAFGKKRPAKKVTPLLAAITWRVAAIKSRLSGGTPLLTRETAATAMAQVHFDNRKLLAALPGFKYREMEKTIADACAALKEKAK